MNKHLIALEARKELARRDFFEFCHLTQPKFYKRNRQYLVDLCNTMQSFFDSDNEDVLVINLPPRHGKSLTATQFVKWLLGRDLNKKIMTGSYNEILSTSFSKAVRNGIQEVKADANKIVYSDIFPKTKVRRGDASMNLWSLEGGYNNYLATSPTGTATGFGADIIIIDDLIRSAEDAYNASVLERHWDWFTNTMLSRLESGGKILIIMTRWHSEDLAGRALVELEQTGYEVKHINMKALQDDGTMLCEDVLSRDEFERKTATMGADIASANYQQEPIDIKGRLYGEFKTYNGELPQFRRIFSYTDTADTGSDYFCCFIAGETFDKEAYILDAIYTKEPMEVTERLAAERHIASKVNFAIVESNNGGRGYARNFKTEMQKKSWNGTVVKWFHQSANKISRILSNSSWVMEHIYFPDNWRHKWPELYEGLAKYQREGKNAHDDAPDALTGIAETIANKHGLVSTGVSKTRLQIR